MAIKTILLSIAAVAVLVVMPIVMVWAVVDYIRGKGRQRRSGGGSVSGFVGAGLQEIDRLMARPSIEHQIEVENQVLKREDDAGGD